MGNCRGVCLREGGIGWNAEEKSAVGGVDADGFSGVLGPENGVFGTGGAAVPDGDDKIGGVNNKLVALQGGAAVKVAFVVGAQDADGEAALCGIVGGKGIHPVCTAGNQFGSVLGQDFADIHLFDGTGADYSNDHI